MPALIDLRRRIKSVRNTQQITQAMKTVSTAKFKKAQRLVLESRPFWHTYPPFLSRVALWAAPSSHPLLLKREEKKVAGLVLTSDKGLCGAFNANLLNTALRFFQNKAQNAEVHVVLIGKKASAFFKRQDFLIDLEYKKDIHKLTGEELKSLAHFLMRRYVLGQADGVYVAYNEFKSILAPRVTITHLLPIELPGMNQEAEKPMVGILPDWTPEESRLLNLLLPGYVENQILHFYSESVAAEHAARMMAMENATKNAEDLITELTLILNKIRQASITKELLEIMTAVEALGKR